MSKATDLHEAVQRGDVATLRRLLDLNQRNKHGLTPLGCAAGGTQGRWRPFSKATLEDWGRTAELIRARGGQE